MTATARDITYRIDVETLAYNIVANLLRPSNEEKFRNSRHYCRILNKLGFTKNDIMPGI